LTRVGTVLVSGPIDLQHVRDKTMNEQPGSAATRLALCAAGDVAPGSALKVEAGGFTLAVINLDGEFFVLDDHCTHGPGSLSEGEILDGVVECNFHQGQFDIRTGEPVLPPCTVPVKTYRVTVDDGRVFIDV
jgi:nitrite reductase/ring-hydroxylating ferredoxin subunit